MATVSGPLIWEIVKKNNAFLVKQFGNGNAKVQFSKESNNLYNVNSFKHSGLANKKTVSIQSGGKDLSVVLATTKTKKQNKPGTLYHRSVMKKEFSKMAKAVMNQAASMHCRMIMENKHSSFRQFSVFNEFSKQLKGEAKSDPEFRQSIKELNEKTGIAKEDLKIRTTKTTEKLYKSVDVAWTEAEAASKKISSNMKEKLSTAKEEVKESFGLGKEESSAYYSSVKDGNEAASRADNSQNSKSSNSKESPGQTDATFGRLKSALSSSPSVSLPSTKLKEANISEIAFETKIAEDMRERWETSDNPVHKNQEYFKSMNFVQSILDEDEQSSQKKNRDFVHVLLLRKKSFVTVTDARGNKKTGASAGCLEERKGRSRRSRYAAEATAEHVGRSARKMGLKSVVMKVKGNTFFKRKSKVILSWREGFRGEGVGDQSPIMYIHDVTQLPHNGCRLPKKRRV